MSVTLSSPVFVKADFLGNNGSGSISVPGLKVGDAILIFTNGNWLTSFEGPVVTVDDQIQQSASGDLSAVNFTVILARWP